MQTQQPATQEQFLELMRPKNINIQCFIDAINELIRFDEIERALWLCDNLPGFFRDYKVAEISEIKNTLLSRIATPSFYAHHVGCEMNLVNGENVPFVAQTLRGQVIIEEVKRLNAANFNPHIVDCGPGEYWLPNLLRSKGLSFTYQPIYLNGPTHNAALKGFKDEIWTWTSECKVPVIFFACEIIEHLWNEFDVKCDMLRACGLADVVHVSTPMYAFDNEIKDWRDKGDIGHLRTYTPSEFKNLIQKMFPEYHKAFYDSQILHCRMVKVSTPFDVLSKTFAEDILGEPATESLG